MTERWLLLAYSCSGFAGLVYEIAWTRLLTLHLGHTTAAVSTVTAAFMGGLGFGGALGGRIASRLSRRQALWVYALLELVVAVAALTIAWSLTLLTPVFAWAYGEDGAGPLFSTVRIASSLGVLLVPGVALGATFPMAVRVAVTSPTRPGGPTGRLYGANTAGAAAGSLAAGFFLIPILGLTGTTLTGMAAGAVSIALALSFVRRDLTVAESEDGSTKTRIERQDARHNRTKPRSRSRRGKRRWSGHRAASIRTCSSSAGADRLRDIRARGGLDARAGPRRWSLALRLRRHTDVVHHGSCAGLLRRRLSRRAPPSASGCARADSDCHRGRGVRECRSRRRLTARDWARHVGTLGHACRHRAAPPGDRVRLDVSDRARSRHRVSAVTRTRRQSRRDPGATIGRPVRGEYRGGGGRGSGGRLHRHIRRGSAHVTARRHHEPAARRCRGGRQWAFLKSRPSCSAPSTGRCRRVDGHERRLGS